MTMKMLVGAAAITALVATPAMATQQNFKGAHAQQMSADATKKVKKMKTQNRLEQSQVSADRRSGFLPLDVATGVVGGALNTAGAIATAPFTPFRGDSYAYYRDPNTGRGMIADDNGPKCLPSKITTINGQKMRCQ
jgi:hypothetical protein